MDGGTFFAKGARVWIPDLHSVFKRGIVEDADETIAKIRVSSGDIEEVSQTKLLGDHDDENSAEMTDMVKLNVLNEATLLDILNQRADIQAYYTYTGPFLLSINPFHKTGLYTAEWKKTFRGHSLRREELPPHPYAVAELCFANILSDARDQSILISGESGAGKTECTKIILEYLVGIDTSVGDLGKKILSSNPILEAFGNAKTVRNNNSSRFGKYFELQYTEEKRVCGARMEQYLHEKSRVIQHAPGERSYHIFYQMCNGMPKASREELHLRPAETFAYLSQGESIACEGLDDGLEFSVVQDALTAINVTASEQAQMFRALAGILHLGDIQFRDVGTEKPVEVVDEEPLNRVCSLLELERARVEESLRFKSVSAGRRGSHYTVPLQLKEANSSRDALAKSLYARVFEWLVDRINMTIANPKATYSVGLLDIFGFESFEMNSFEQLCINYTNEKLQQLYLDHVFKSEQAAYQREGIDAAIVNFCDNQGCLDLIERTRGLLAILNDECKVGNASDENFLSQLVEVHGKNKYFEVLRGRGTSRKSSSGTSRTSFVIRHYAGQVCYEGLGFVEKNKDAMLADLVTVIRQSKSEFLLKLFGADASTAARKATVATKFKGQLNALITRLRETDSHFIRCIKPNPFSRPHEFDRGSVVSQLRASGVMSTVAARKLGFAERRPFKDFIERNALTTSIDLDIDDETNCLKLLNDLHLPEDWWALGRTMVFLRQDAVSFLERFRATAIYEYAAKLQRQWHTYWLRKTIEERSIVRQRAVLTKRNDAARTIQLAFRAFVVRRQLRAVVSSAWAAEMERRESARKERERQERERVEQEKREKARKLREEKELKDRMENERKGREEAERKQREEDLLKERKMQTEADKAKKDKEESERIARLERLELERRENEENDRRRQEAERKQRESEGTVDPVGAAAAEAAASGRVLVSTSSSGKLSHMITMFEQTSDRPKSSSPPPEIPRKGPGKIASRVAALQAQTSSPPAPIPVGKITVKNLEHQIAGTAVKPVPIAVSKTPGKVHAMSRMLAGDGPQLPGDDGTIKTPIARTDQSNRHEVKEKTQELSHKTKSRAKGASGRKPPSRKKGARNTSSAESSASVATPVTTTTLASKAVPMNTAVASSSATAAIPKGSAPSVKDESALSVPTGVKARIASMRLEKGGLGGMYAQPPPGAGSPSNETSSGVKARIASMRLAPGLALGGGGPPSGAGKPASASGTEGGGPRLQHITKERAKTSGSRRPPTRRPRDHATCTVSSNVSQLPGMDEPATVPHVKSQVETDPPKSRFGLFRMSPAKGGDKGAKVSVKTAATGSTHDSTDCGGGPNTAPPKLAVSPQKAHAQATENSGLHAAVSSSPIAAASTAAIVGTPFKQDSPQYLKHPAGAAGLLAEVTATASASSRTHSGDSSDSNGKHKPGFSMLGGAGIPEEAAQHINGLKPSNDHVFEAVAPEVEAAASKLGNTIRSLGGKSGRLDLIHEMSFRRKDVPTLIPTVRRKVESMVRSRIEAELSKFSARTSRTIYLNLEAQEGGKTTKSKLYTRAQGAFLYGYQKADSKKPKAVITLSEAAFMFGTVANKPFVQLAVENKVFSLSCDNDEDFASWCKYLVHTADFLDYMKVIGPKDTCALPDYRILAFFNNQMYARSLDLSNWGMPLAVAKSLAPAVERLPMLTVVCLANANLDNAHMKALEAALAAQPLEELDLSLNPFTSATELASIIRASPDLAVLRLAEVKFGDHGMEELSAALSTHRPLALLDMSKGDISDQGMCVLMDALVSANRATNTSPKVSPATPERTPASLSLSPPMSPRMRPPLKPSAGSAAKLGPVALAQTVVTGGSSSAARDQSRGHFALAVGGNAISDFGASAIADSVERGIRYSAIRLDENSINDEGAGKLAAILPNSTISELDLSGNPLSDTAIYSLVRSSADAPSMKRLQLPNGMSAGALDLHFRFGALLRKEGVMSRDERNKAAASAVANATLQSAGGSSQPGQARAVHANYEIGMIMGQVLEARNLPAASTLMSRGHSDPTCVVQLTPFQGNYGAKKRQRHQTSTVRKTCNPKWTREEFKFSVYEWSENVSIEVFDSQRFGRDVLLGMVSVQLGSVTPEESETWLPLKPREGEGALANKDGNQGEILIRLSFLRKTSRRSVFVPGAEGIAATKRASRALARGGGGAAVEAPVEVVALNNLTVKAIAAVCSELTIFDLSCSPYLVTDDCLSSLANGAPHLEVLNLGVSEDDVALVRACKDGISDSGILSLVQSCTALKTLSIARRSHISVNAVQKLLTVGTLLDLDISGLESCSTLDSLRILVQVPGASVQNLTVSLDQIEGDRGAIDSLNKLSGSDGVSLKLEGDSVGIDNVYAL